MVLPWALFLFVDKVRFIGLLFCYLKGVKKIKYFGTPNTQKITGGNYNDNSNDSVLYFNWYYWFFTGGR